MNLSPKKRVVIEYLAEQCRRGALHTGDRLPSLRLLARRAGVSLVTVQETIAWCKQHTYVDRSHRLLRAPRMDDNEIRTTFLRTWSGRKSPPVWRRTAERLERDLMEGVFRPGEALPSMKELCARYGVSYPTIRKVIDYLVHEQVLTDRDAHLSVPRTPRATEHLSLVLLIRGAGNGNMVAGTLDTEFIRSLEMECRKARIGLKIILHAEAGRELRFWKCGTGEPVRFDFGREVIGCVYVVNGPQSRRDDLIPLCGAMRRKVAVQDHFGITPLPRSIVHNPRCTVFSSSISASAGRTVGRYLHDCGHRHIAFVSPFHGEQVWSHRRLQGVKAALEHDKTASVRVVSLPYSQLSELLDADDTPPEFLEAVASFNRWRDTVSPEVEWAVMSSSSRQSRPSWVGWSRVYEKLSPLLAELLDDTNVSAWVCVNDRTALMAMDFLQRRKVGVGSRISLVGFDDVRESLEQGLTSYNYNIPSCAHAVLMYMLNRVRLKQKVVKIDGYVVTRESVAHRTRRHGS